MFTFIPVIPHYSYPYLYACSGSFCFIYLLFEIVMLIIFMFFLSSVLKK